MGGYECIWMDMGAYGWIWVHMDVYGWIWVDMGGHEWIWVDITYDYSREGLKFIKITYDYSWEVLKIMKKCMVYTANMTCWTILYWFLQGQIQNTLIIAESGEGDMHQLRSLSRKVRCSARSAVHGSAVHGLLKGL